MSIQYFRRSTRLAAMFLSMTAATAGCAARRTSLALPDIDPISRATMVVVDNGSLTDMNVYMVVVAAGERYRLGRVDAFSSRQFTVPRAVSLPADISLLTAAVVTGETSNTSSISVWQGDTIRLVVAGPMQLSGLLKR
jgi:hypothetical protein